MLRVVSLVTVAVYAACAPAERPIGSCLYWTDCGPGGVCEYSEFQSHDPPRFSCSFPDASCPVTRRRYGELATPNIASTCVPYVAEALDAYCDDSHACTRGRACVANRCISYSALSASAGVSSVVCSHEPSEGGDLWVWGIAFELTGEEPHLAQLGEGSVPPPAPPPAPPVETRSATIGAAHVCVVGGGFSECLGRDDRLGDGAQGRWGRATPMGPHTTLSAAVGHTCGARSDAIDCWGDNASGQLDGVPGAASAAARTTAYSAKLVALSAGSTFTCAASAVDVTCWGGSWASGTFASNVLQGLPPAAAITALDAGEAHGCVIKGGEVWCWGANDAGQATGSPTPFPVRSTRVALRGVAVAVVAGSRHSCAVTGDQEVWCWGGNTLGQLGSATAEAAPVRVPLGIPASALIAAGNDHTCAVLADSIVHCWGAPQVIEAPPITPRLPICL